MSRNGFYDDKVAGRRAYTSFNDGCAAAHALDIVGDRWALLVARELVLGPKRFSDLERDVRGISASALTQCLRDLAMAGVLHKPSMSRPASARVYQLTPWGEQLEAVIGALSAWGSQSATLPSEADMSPDAVVLAMRAHAQVTSARARRHTVALTLRDARHDDGAAATYVATFGASSPTIGKGSADAADVEVATDSSTWQQLLFGRTDLKSSLDSDRIALRPESATATRLVEQLLNSFRPGA